MHGAIKGWRDEEPVLPHTLHLPVGQATKLTVLLLLFRESLAWQMLDTGFSWVTTSTTWLEDRNPLGPDQE